MEALERMFELAQMIEEDRLASASRKK
jgi:hypothetical protein